MAIFRVPVEFTWPGTGSPGANVWHVRAGVGADEADDLQAMVDAIHTFYAALANPAVGGDQVYAPGVSFSLGNVVDVDDRRIMNPTWAPITSFAQGTTAAAPLNIVCGWRTSIAARRGMGRTFIGPLQGGAQEADGTLADGFATKVLNAAQALVTESLAALNGAIVVYGLESAAAPGTTDYSGLPRVGRDITGVGVKAKYGVLRSRRD